MIINKLSEILGRKRMSKAELARLSKVSYSAIKKLYNDETLGIDFTTLNKLCNALDCTPNEILHFIPD